jgi:hypothetical protein
VDRRPMDAEPVPITRAGADHTGRSAAVHRVSPNTPLARHACDAGPAGDPSSLVARRHDGRREDHRVRYDQAVFGWRGSWTRPVAQRVADGAVAWHRAGGDG